MSFNRFIFEESKAFPQAERHGFTAQIRDASPSVGANLSGATDPSRAGCWTRRQFEIYRWNIVLLFGGGFALAKGFVDSGLSAWFADQLSAVGNMPPVMLACLLLTLLTELTSSTATAEMFLPILAALAVAVGLNLLLLMIPGALSCLFAFMLPVAKPLNTSEFAANRVAASDVARASI